MCVCVCVCVCVCAVHVCMCVRVCARTLIDGNMMTALWRRRWRVRGKLIWVVVRRHSTHISLSARFTDGISNRVPKNAWLRSIFMLSQSSPMTHGSSPGSHLRMYCSSYDLDVCKIDSAKQLEQEDCNTSRQRPPEVRKPTPKHTIWHWHVPDLTNWNRNTATHRGGAQHRHFAERTTEL